MQRAVGSYMVKGPYLGDREMSLRAALELMKECNVRHLPITEDNKLIGIVSERDIQNMIHLYESKSLTIEDIMKRDVFFVTRSTPLREVIEQLRERKIGSAVVVDQEKTCVGIFTTIDALDVLADLLDHDDDEENVLSIEDYFESWSYPRAAHV